MNGVATETAVQYLRSVGEYYLADEVEAEYKQLTVERDHARDLAVQYEEQLHRATAEDFH